MSKAHHFFRLQQIDSQIDRLKVQFASIETALSDDSILDQIRASFQEASTRYSSAESKQNDLEKEFRNTRVKIEQIEASLYSTKSRTPKELLELENDVTSLKRYHIELENKLMEEMITTEAAQIELDKVQRSLKTTEDGYAHARADLLNKQSILSREITKTQTERTALIDSLQSDEVDFYENLRTQKQGVAVCQILENACNACGSTLTLALVQAARSSGTISQCPTCGRILFSE